MSRKEYKYTIDGLAQADCPEHRIYAMKWYDGKREVYMVRHATTGPECPHLLNPWSMHFSPDVDDRRFERHLGKRRYEYKEVKKDVFDLYVKFLETRKDSYYRNAERAMD